MKSGLIVLAVLAVIASGINANLDSPCHGVKDGIFVWNPVACDTFWLCAGSVAIPGSCPEPFYFNFAEQTCDWPENVDCRLEPEEPEEPEQPSSTTALETTEEPSTTEETTTELETTTVAETTTEEVTEAPSVCAGAINGELVGSEESCGSFYHCVDEVGFESACPEGLLFNGNYCDLESRVQCGDVDSTTVAPETEGPTESSTEGATEGATEGPTTEPEDSEESEEPESPVDPDTICVGRPDGTFINNPESCNAFFYCFENIALRGFCPDPFFFNPVNGICDWPHYVECTDDEPEIEEPSSEESSGEEPSTDEPTEEPTEEPETEAPETEAPETEAPSTEEPTTTEAPEEPSRCLPGEVGLHPHSSSCSQYILCFNGAEFPLVCNAGEHFSKDRLACVPKELADCRLEDPFCDPIESESRALYFPHPHFCEQFFLCFRGQLAVLSCANGNHWDSQNGCVSEEESTCAA